MGGVLGQHQEAPGRGVPHVLVPGHVGEDAVLDDLRRREESVSVGALPSCGQQGESPAAAAATSG